MGKSQILVYGAGNLGQAVLEEAKRRYMEDERHDSENLLELFPYAVGNSSIGKKIIIDYDGFKEGIEIVSHDDLMHILNEQDTLDNLVVCDTSVGVSPKDLWSSLANAGIVKGMRLSSYLRGAEGQDLSFLNNNNVRFVDAANASRDIVETFDVMRAVARNIPNVLAGCNVTYIDSHQGPDDMETELIKEYGELLKIHDAAERKAGINAFKEKYGLSNLGKEDFSATVNNKTGPIFTELGVPYDREAPVSVILSKYDYYIYGIKKHCVRGFHEQSKLAVPEKDRFGHAFHFYLITPRFNKSVPTKFLRSFEKQMSYSQYFGNLKDISENDSIRQVLTHFEEKGLVPRRKYDTVALDGTLFSSYPSGDVNVGIVYTKDHQMAMLFHTVSGRETYARGALDAARFVLDKDVKPGMYDMADVWAR